LTAVFIAAGQLITPIGNMFGMVRPTLTYVFVTASYPVIMLIVYEVYKLIKNSDIKRKKKNLPKSGNSVKSIFSSGFRVEDTDEDRSFDKIITEKENIKSAKRQNGRLGNK
jgi:hypothetical protein